MSFVIEPARLLFSNNVDFSVGPDYMQIGEYSIPLDGYTDSLRLHHFVSSRVVEKSMQECISIPRIVPALEKLDPLIPFELLKEYRISHNTNGTFPNNGIIWGGSFQTTLDDYVDDEGEIELPEMDGLYYYNIVVSKLNRSSFHRVYDPKMWIARECEAGCVKAKHFHYVAANYPDTFSTLDGCAGEREIVAAPPIHLIPELATLKLDVGKSSIVDEVIESRNKIAMAVSKPIQAAAAPPVEGAKEEGSQDVLETNIFAGATLALDAIALSGDLTFLKGVVRDDKNRWKSDSLGVTTNACKTVKARLNSVFTAVYNQAVHNGDTLSALIEEYRKRTKCLYTSKTNDQYFLNRMCNMASVAQDEQGKIFEM